MVFKLAHYGLSTFLIEVMTMMMMMMMIKCAIIIIIIIIIIIDTALVDRVCICHLRKETPTIRFPPRWPTLGKDSSSIPRSSLSQTTFFSVESPGRFEKTVLLGRSIGYLGGLSPPARHDLLLGRPYTSLLAGPGRMPYTERCLP